MKEKVQKIIDQVKPYIAMHGGDVSILEIKDGIVKLKVSGACVGCSLAHLTYDKMLGEVIRSEIPEIKEIIIEN